MSGKSSQRKGANGERELATLLRQYGHNIQRGGSLSFGEVPDLSGLPGVHIECKRREQAQIWEWMAQAERDAQRFGDGVPAVFFRRSRSDWLICMELKDWLDLYERAQGCKCGGHCQSGKE